MGFDVVGAFVGFDVVGAFVGVGALVGFTVGLFVGALVGFTVGLFVVTYVAVVISIVELRRKARRMLLEIIMFAESISNFCLEENCENGCEETINRMLLDVRVHLCRCGTFRLSLFTLPC